MGRNHHNHLRLPEHLYLSPPPPPTPPFSFTSASLLAVKAAVLFSPSANLFWETGGSKPFAVGDRIPGFKTSAAFLTTLRANLILDLESTPPSLANTPDILRPTDMASSSGLPPPSPSPLVQSAQTVGEASALAETQAGPLDGVPELTTKPAVTEDDKVEALHLIADSVAQQRQLASAAVIFHPLTISVLVLFLGLAYQNLYKGAYSDWAIIGTTSAGILMAVLITVRWLTSGYIFEAERVGTWKWLNEGRDNSDKGIVGSEDEILLTRFGDDIIGTIVVRGVRDSSGSSGKSRKNVPTNGYIRAWTVKRIYRHKGVGQGLLEEAVALCQQKGWSGPEFAEDHANSANVLHPTFSGGFRKKERQAREMLERVIEESRSNASGKKGKR
ncbi:uncharacterized protein Z520_00640 [Fonsecaea multimorphosa CBS 102226]|uniref:N-acetyltransferase domain-containing protein n=1 Tax=Fonsecaea multimorphosa CBS 102226 TaxID=1442371 RepID=A0A0D2KCV4_9EURO|nr:uncharacterized protein Z520_00640 [Fonsecaea multimorphosa CBS 102226]KIY03948.1 hypothetical protein Z520_00640 [Fonsecaea multimorphosa CBS 102226]OAL31788.1 hypothetical protein AYO22_00658 [Fonsecaea multimorphosa]